VLKVVLNTINHPPTDVSNNAVKYSCIDLSCILINQGEPDYSTG